MGAVAGKAVGDFPAAAAAAAPRTQAEHRLAVAEHAVLGWHRARSSGIWDSDATCTNKSLLSAVDDIVHLSEIHAFPMASAARRRMESALALSMSCFMEEFLRLRVWDASQLEGHRTGLRFAVDKLSAASAAAAASGVSLVFPTGGSFSTGSSTLDELYVSGGSQSSGHDAVSVFLDGKFLDELDLILLCPASPSVLHEIALRVIRAGYTNELLHTFTNSPCDVLDRFRSILRLECSLETGKVISFEDAEWWTTEDMIKRWIVATKLVRKALAVMQRQLHAQSCGAFDRFKNDYFMAIAKRNIFVLLKFADGFTSTQSPEKLVYVLEMYEALSDAAPGFLLLFTGEHAGLISPQVEVVLAKLARALRIMVGGLLSKIRTDCSQPAQSVVGVGVHPLARYAMNCVELLAPHRAALDLVLANGGGCGAPAGESVACSFGSLVSVLVACLERNLEEKPSPSGARAAGSRHLFLATNAGFVTKRAVDAADMASLLGDGWAARRESLVARRVASYVEASWAPVVACLATVGGRGKRKPIKVVAKFTSAFERAYSDEVCREVPDPALRAALRKAASEMVVPAYRMYLQKHPTLEDNVRYTASELEQLLAELFEGGAAEHGKS